MLFRQIKHVHIKHTYTITIYIKISYKYCKIDGLILVCPRLITPIINPLNKQIRQRVY